MRYYNKLNESSSNIEDYIPSDFSCIESFDNGTERFSCSSRLVDYSLTVLISPNSNYGEVDIFDEYGLGIEVQVKKYNLYKVLSDLQARKNIWDSIKYLYDNNYIDIVSKN